MLFWFIAAGLALAVSGVLVAVLIRGRGAEAPAAAYDVAVYRDQLNEIDRDLARGILSADEAARVRVEVSRRLLEADRAREDAAAADRAPRWLSYTAAGLATVAVAGGALGLYARIGAPGYGDLPLATRIERAEQAKAGRPGQAAAEESMAARMPQPTEAAPEFLELMDKLRTALADRPDDLQGYRLLARNEARLGNYAAAYRAQGRVLEILGEQASASDYADYADLMILAAGGYVSPEAESALEAALARDPRNGPARYYTGLLNAQAGRADEAFRIWRALLEESRAGAPWARPILSQIGEVAQLAGVRYTPPDRFSEAPAPRGPSRDDMEAAAEMSPEERMQMIRGMVDGLSDRLATEGGPPAEWARLVNALGVLGETDRAGAIWDEAQQVFADAPEALATIRAAAERAGVAE